MTRSKIALKAFRSGFRLWASVLALLLSAISSSSVVYGQQDKHASLIPIESRKTAPSFELQGQDGRKVRIGDYRGKVVLLNFWATDCGGCVLEIPSFIELEKAYHTRNFTTLGVAMDISYEGLKDSNEAWARVRPFISKKGINYQIAMGDDTIAKAYGLDAYPATYLIDKSGRIAVAYKGLVVDKGNIETNIKGLLLER